MSFKKISNNTAILAAFALIFCNYAYADASAAAAVGGLLGWAISQSQGSAVDLGLSKHGLVPYDKKEVSTKKRRIIGKFDNEGAMNDADSAVKPNDIVNVILKKVTIGTDAYISMQTADKLANGAQLAIVANAYEMCDTQPCPVGMTYGADDYKEGKVVYFSDNVMPDQKQFSFGAVPMFGPFKYHGYPVGIQLHVVKVANDQTGKLGPMLSALASAAQNSGLSVGATSILNSIGSNLLKGFDVRLMRYHSQFNQAVKNEDDKSVGITKLYYGDYIVIRTEKRQEDIDFDEFCYDPRKAKLYDRQGDDCTDNTEKSNKVTYGIINVSKGDREAYAKQETYLTLSQALQSSSTGPNGLSAKVVSDIVKPAAFNSDLLILQESPKLSKTNIAYITKVKGVLDKLGASTAGATLNASTDMCKLAAMPATNPDAYSQDQVNLMRQTVFVITNNLVSCPVNSATEYSGIAAKFQP